jgi:hypothetical protein
MLDHIIGLLKGAERFYEDPGQQQAFLAREGIDYVVVYRKPPTNVNLRAFPANVSAFSNLPFLRPVFRNPQVLIFRVVGIYRRQPLPLASDHPGYDCNSVPIKIAEAAPG